MEEELTMEEIGRLEVQLSKLEVQFQTHFDDSNRKMDENSRQLGEINKKMATNNKLLQNMVEQLSVMNTQLLQLFGDEAVPMPIHTEMKMEDRGSSASELEIASNNFKIQEKKLSSNEIWDVRTSTFTNKETGSNADEVFDEMSQLKSIDASRPNSKLLSDENEIYVLLDDSDLPNPIAANTLARDDDLKSVDGVGSSLSNDKVDDKLTKQSNCVSAVDISIIFSRACRLGANWGSILAIFGPTTATQQAENNALTAGKENEKLCMSVICVHSYLYFLRPDTSMNYRAFHSWFVVVKKINSQWSKDGKQLHLATPFSVWVKEDDRENVKMNYIANMEELSGLLVIYLFSHTNIVLLNGGCENGAGSEARRGIEFFEGMHYVVSVDAICLGDSIGIHPWIVDDTVASIAIMFSDSVGIFKGAKRQHWFLYAKSDCYFILHHILVSSTLLCHKNRGLLLSNVFSNSGRSTIANFYGLVNFTKRTNLELNPRLLNYLLHSNIKFGRVRDTLDRLNAMIVYFMMPYVPVINRFVSALVGKDIMMEVLEVTEEFWVLTHIDSSNLTILFCVKGFLLVHVSVVLVVSHPLFLCKEKSIVVSRIEHSLGHAKATDIVLSVWFGCETSLEAPQQWICRSLSSGLLLGYCFFLTKLTIVMVTSFRSSLSMSTRRCLVTVMTIEYLFEAEFFHILTVSTTFTLNQYTLKEVEFEEFYVAAISTYQSETREYWKHLVSVAFEYSEHKRNHVIYVELLAEERNLSHNLDLVSAIILVFDPGSSSFHGSSSNYLKPCKSAFHKYRYSGGNRGTNLMSLLEQGFIYVHCPCVGCLSSASDLRLSLLVSEATLWFLSKCLWTFSYFSLNIPHCWNCWFGCFEYRTMGTSPQNKGVCVVDQAESKMDNLKNVSNFLAVAKHTGANQILLPQDVPKNKISSAAITSENETEDKAKLHMINWVALIVIVVAAVLIAFDVIGLFFIVYTIQPSHCGMDPCCTYRYHMWCNSCSS